MASVIGNKLKVQLFGQSHSQGLGVVIDGLPAGEKIDGERIVAFLKRRAGGQNTYSTPRAEADIPTVLSGLVNDTTCGAPLCVVFENKNTRSSDYEALRFTPRPSHADYTAHVKYAGRHDIRGGGHFSARLTLPLCFAGAVCLSILERKGITARARVQSIGDIQDESLPGISGTGPCLWPDGFPGDFPAFDPTAGEKMIAAIETAAAEGDSVGGVVECGIWGLPAGLGEPIFDNLESRLAYALFAIPAVKGVEFGAGFAAARMRGSVYNDAFFMDGETVKTKTNHSGGILGGIANGMPVIFKAAFKPTPSIAQPQATVNLKTGEAETLRIHGRHDPCVVPRAVPCVEAAAAIVILDMIL